MESIDDTILEERRLCISRYISQGATFEHIACQIWIATVFKDIQGFSFSFSFLFVYLAVSISLSLMKLSDVWKLS